MHITKYKHLVLPAGSFVLFLALGICIYKDFGISWDEETSKHNGLINYSYIVNSDPSLLSDPEKYHGPVFEIFLVFAEKISGLTDRGDIYRLRHLLTFALFYLGTIFFYLICKYLFGSWKVGLLGTLLLVASPRIFAHSFYNSKDLAFLSISIICVWTLISFLNKRNLFYILLHALACAILIDIRIMGAFFPLLTIVFCAKEFVHSKRKTSIIKQLAIFGISTICLVIFFWPVLWDGPVSHFIQAFKEMKYYNKYQLGVLYMGERGLATELPWHYLPVWILLTTPVLYTVSFFAGLYAIARRTLANHKLAPSNQLRNDLIPVLWFFVPLIMVIALDAVLFDAWRHMFFIYPALLLIALSGLNHVSYHINAKFTGTRRFVTRAILSAIVFFGVVETAYFMIRDHPHQNVYFSEVVRLGLVDVSGNFEVDYWGLSYKQALEYLLEHDASERILIFVKNTPGLLNMHLLPSKDRGRIESVNDVKKAKYFITNFRGAPDNDLLKNEVYSIKIGDAKLIGIYQLRD